MIIEFFGPSGAGKTVLAQKVAKALDGVYIKERSASALARLVQFAIRRPRFCLFLFGRIVRGRTLFQHKLFLLARVVGREQDAQLYHGEEQERPVILDEGFAQFGLALYERGISSDEAGYYSDYLSNDRVIVFVQAPLQERFRRMHERGRIPRNYLGVDVEEREQIVEENATQFVQTWKSHSTRTTNHIRVITVHTAGSKTTNEVANDLVQALHTHNKNK